MIGEYYMQIPIRELKKQLKNNTDECKKTLSYDNITVSKSIFGLFSKLINKFERTKSYQTGLFIKSMNDWLDRYDQHHKPLDAKIGDINVGDIFMVDWNLSYTPELSYEHPCVVIEKVGDFLFVLLVSGQKQYIEMGYHPTKNKLGDKNYRIVDTSDGFNKQCVIHINQAKVISQTRILYKMGNLTTNELGECELFEEIKDTMLNTYFPNEYNKLLEENNEYKRRLDYLSIQRKCNQSRADKYRNENEKLKREIEQLKADLSNSEK